MTTRINVTFHIDVPDVPTIAIGYQQYVYAQLQFLASTLTADNLQITYREEPTPTT